MLYVHMDKDYVYYVEEQRSLSDKHVAYEGNIDIGVADRRIVEEAFAQALVCCTVDINEDLLRNQPINLKPLKDYMNNYIKSEDDFGDAIDWYGRGAIKKIISMCEGRDNIYVVGNLYDHNDYNLFRTNISRKRILQRWVIKYLDNKELAGVIGECCDKWEYIRKVMITRKYKNINYLDIHLKQHFENILLLEDRIYENFIKDASLMRYLAADTHG